MARNRKGGQLIVTTFKAAGLPDVWPDQLETGTYTNRQIAEKFADPFNFVAMMAAVSRGISPASTRSTISFAVEMM